MRPKTFQAKHIPDRRVLKVLQILGNANERTYGAWHNGASRWEVIDAFKPIPWKIVQAKLTSLHRRKLVDGCAGCTCGGQFTLTDAGRALLVGL